MENGCIWFIFTALQVQLVVTVKRTKLDIYTFKMHPKYFRALFSLEDFANKILTCADAIRFLKCKSFFFFFFATQSKCGLLTLNKKYGMYYEMCDPRPAGLQSGS